MVLNFKDTRSTPFSYPDILLLQLLNSSYTYQHFQNSCGVIVMLLPNYLIVNSQAVSQSENDSIAQNRMSDTYVNFWNTEIILHSFFMLKLDLR